MADRILVMCEGRKTAEFARGEASEEQILRAALARIDVRAAVRPTRTNMTLLQKTHRETLAKFQSLIALALMVVAMSLLSDRFLTVDNGANILRQISMNVCLSLGMTMVILSGGIDLSVGSVLALCGAVTAGLLKNGIGLERFDILLEFTVLGAVAGGLLAGLLCGLFNGVMITRLSIPPFVATLGVMSIARGLTMLWTQGHPITGLGDPFGLIGRARWLGIPTPVWIAAALVCICSLVAYRTRFGRSVYALGGNERAARLSGLRVDRIKVVVYSLAGLLAARGRFDPDVATGFGTTQCGIRVRTRFDRRSRDRWNFALRRTRFDHGHRCRLSDHWRVEQRTVLTQRLPVLAASGQRSCHSVSRSH